MTDLIKGYRISTGLLRIIAVGAGDGGLATNAIAAYTMPAVAKRLVIRKIHWLNRSGVNGTLLVGFGDLTGAGSLFRQVMPGILMVNGFDGVLSEDELPLCGNNPQGFVPDTTLITGSTGAILIESTIATIAAGTPVEVQMEIEVF